MRKKKWLVYQRERCRAREFIIHSKSYILLVISAEFKCRHFWWHGGAVVHEAWVDLGGQTQSKQYVQVLECAVFILSSVPTNLKTGLTALYLCWNRKIVYVKQHLEWGNMHHSPLWSQTILFTACIKSVMLGIGKDILKRYLGLMNMGKGQLLNIVLDSGGQWSCKQYFVDSVLSSIFIIFLKSPLK